MREARQHTIAITNDWILERLRRAVLFIIDSHCEPPLARGPQTVISSLQFTFPIDAGPHENRASHSVFSRLTVTRAWEEPSLLRRQYRLLPVTLSRRNGSAKEREFSRRLRTNANQHRPNSIVHSMIHDSIQKLALSIAQATGSISSPLRICPKQ